MSNIHNDTKNVLKKSYMLVFF